MYYAAVYAAVCLYYAAVCLYYAAVCLYYATGASMSIINTNTYEQLWPNRQGPTLEPTEVKLKTLFTGEVVCAYGSISVKVSHNDQEKQLSHLIVPGSGPSPMGRDWLQHLTLDWTLLHEYGRWMAGSCALTYRRVQRRSLDS